MTRRLLLWLLCQFVLLAGSLHCLMAILQGSPRADSYIRAFDQVLGVGMGCDEDLMPSAKAWMLKGCKWWGRLQRFLDWIDPGHCERSYRDEMAKRKAFMLSIHAAHDDDI